MNKDCKYFDYHYFNGKINVGCCTGQKNAPRCNCGGDKEKCDIYGVGSMKLEQQIENRLRANFGLIDEAIIETIKEVIREYNKGENNKECSKIRKETVEKFALKLADYFVENCGGRLCLSLTLQEWYKMIDEICK